MNIQDAMKKIERDQMKKSIPDFKIGDVVRVSVNIKEGDKERLQAFEGVVIRRRNLMSRSTFTVRKVAFGIGVERTFPLFSPNVKAIKLVRQGHVRRAKLYYLRDKIGKNARVKEKKRFNIGNVENTGSGGTATETVS